MDNVTDPNFDNPNYLENIIRQRKLIGTFGGGLPSPLPQGSEQSTPDLTVHHLVGTMPQSQVPQNGGQQITPQAQQAIAPTQNIPAPAPIVPKVGPIDPNSPQPAESAYKQAIMNEPMKADYHPSKLRNVLSQIAGVATGAFQGGPEGARVMARIRDAPYNAQHEDWKQFATNRGTLATEEAAGTAASGKAALTNAQIREQQSLADLHNHEAKTYHPTTAQEAVDQSQGRLKVDTREAKMMDGTIKHLVQRNGLFYDPETNARVDRAAIEDISDEGKSLKETRASRIPGNLGESVQARKIIAAGVGGKTEDGVTVDQPTFDAAKKYVQKLEDGAEPSGAYADIVRTMEKEQGKPLTSAQKIKLDNSLRPPIGPTILGPADTSGSRTVLPLRPGATVPAGSQTPSSVSQENTDTSVTRTMQETAPHVVSFMNKLDTEVDQNLKDLGPAAGRWADFWTGKVGAPNPSFAKLRTDTALAKTMLMRMHLGARGGQQMYQHFNDMLDLAGQDPQNLKAAIGAIRDYANEIASGAHGGSGGNKPQATKRYNPATGQIEDINNASR